LQHSIDVYDKIADEWEKSKTIWFSTLNELRESRSTYQNHKDGITLFEDVEFRRSLFQYYLRSGDLINQLEYCQRRRYELEGKFNDLVRDIRCRNTSVSHADAVKTAQDYMQSENQEFLNLGDSIPVSVNKLRDFRNQAKNLLANFRKLQ